MATTTHRSQPKPATTSRSPLAVLRHEMDDLISRFWDGEQERWFSGHFAPAVDLIESPAAFEIRLDIPGMNSNDIDVQVHGNMVTLSGKRVEEKEDASKTYHRAERRMGSFSRMLTLPCEINESEVAAEYSQGVLRVTLPKCEEARMRKVPVKG
jgi:HSP20 family protein